MIEERKCKLKPIYLFIFTFIITFMFISEFSLKFISDISPIISVIVALINLRYVVSIFSYDKKEREKEKYISRKSYWYRNIIIDRNVNFISGQFNKMELLAASISNLDGLDDKVTIQLYQEAKRDLMNNVNNMIRILDDKFAVLLDDLLDDFEDDFTTKYEILLCSDEKNFDICKEDLNASVRNKKEEYLKELYEYERNGYTITVN